MHTCNGTFKQLCKEHDLPISFLTRSYKSETVLKFKKVRGVTANFYEKYKPYEGWYAIKQ